MWTQGLNPEQVKAVAHNQGPLLILAGAGSGKTTVLVARTGRMIAEGIARPEEICVLTFTNKAARELKHRVGVKLGDRAKGLWSGTFHSFGLRLLRTYHREAGLPTQFGVIDQNDSQSILKELMKDIKVTGKDKFDLEAILEIINERRVRGREKLEGFDEYHEMAEILLPKFIKKMELLGVVDFESLLLKPLELFREHPQILEKVQNQFKYLMVDEFQDTNLVQMKLIEKMVDSHRNLCVVGDDDQSIYGWRGAQISNILDFPKNFKPCEVIRLERNYRSSPVILKVANELIQKNKHRHGKILKAEGRFRNEEMPEAFLLPNEDEEAQFVVREIRNWLSMGYKFGDIAILYRSNSQGGLLEGHFRQNQIAYSVSGGTAFFDRKEIKDILAYLRFSISPNDVSLRRIINTPPRGIGDTTVERINSYAISHKISFLKACHAWQAAGAPDKAGEAIEHLFAQLRALPSRLMNPDPNETPGQRLLKFLNEIHYREFLISTSKDPQGADKKWTLVEIFARVMDSFAKKGGANEKTLREFVDALELRDDVNDDEDRNKVSLMTLHACKGLEFPCVMIVGVEEDLIPHKTLGSDVDEERRLFYVGLTRAKERLILTRCQVRSKYGQQRPVSPSRFLLEIPTESIRDYKGEFRPVTATQREGLLAGFLAGLDSKVAQTPKIK
ncbi:MAG: ATP-dependent helicase [Pseudobdellovibrionaceae bacterium]